jgi:hypothetical protein
MCQPSRMCGAPPFPSIGQYEPGGGNRDVDDSTLRIGLRAEYRPVYLGDLVVAESSAAV